MTYTRQDYLSRKCTHREYYGQFVNETVKNIVSHYFTKEQIKEALQKDENLNSIPLAKWDGIAMQPFRSIGLGKLFKDAGDSYTLATGVCLAKEAARQLIEQ